MVDEKVIEAFHMMWDSFPEIVALIHKDKTVLAVNEAARDMGAKAGRSCCSVGTPESHKGCKACQAISSTQAQMLRIGSEKIKYWLPVRGCTEVYVHYTITID